MSRRGSNTVEFALVTPLLLAMVSGIVDYSWFFTNQTGMVYAVREGTRTGALCAQGGDPEDAAIMSVVAELEGQEVVGDANITATLSNDPYPTQTITVSANADWVPLIGLLPTPAKISATWTMRMEDQPDVAYDTGI
jgi:Flp pilus assembly protein TadG